jgi:hypothetical protein
MTDNLENKILIEGITPNGQSFRPSDWAERMSGNLSTFKKQRIHYSPLLYPIRQQDCSCLLVAPSLEETHPELFAQIMDFARLNQLRVTLP